MEGLGSAACTAPPLVFGSALLRRARILSEQAVTSPSEAETLVGFGFFVLPKKLCPGKRILSAMPNAASVPRGKAASNHCGGALAAKGRTARADAARDFGDLARPSDRLTAWDVRAFETRPLKAC